MASGSPDKDADWKYEAKMQQINMADFFNKFDICPVDVLKDRLAVSLFGTPETIESNWECLSYKQYPIKQQNVVENISQCISDHQKYTRNDKIHIRFVLVLGRTKKDQTNFLNWIYNVPGKDGKNITFIDRNCRVYTGWEDYETHNTLPKATICYPFNGIYPEKGCNVQVKYADTPSCSVGRDVLFGFDIATAVTSLAGSGIITAALFVPIAAPFVISAFAFTAASGAYSAGRSIEHLVDRGKHEETLSPLNSNARSAWLGATVPVFGIAAGSAAAVAATARVTSMGLSISEAGRMAINVTNGVNCFAQGLYVANDMYNIIESAINGNEITTIQIFQCIANILLFSNAVVSTHQARMILQSYIENTGSFQNFYGKLSQTCQVENGTTVRLTNFLSTANISSLIPVAISWGGIVLKMSPLICESIEKIFHFLMKNRNSEISEIVRGLLDLLRELWTQVEKHTKKRPYQCQWNQVALMSPASARTSNKETDSNEKIYKNVNHSSSVHSQTEVENNGDDVITILNMNWEGQTEAFQKLIQDVLKHENLSEFEVLEFTHVLFQSLKKELEDKEKHFKTMCQKNKMSEKELEDIMLIQGNRSQYFANEITKSYRDLKIIALKQDCQKLIEEKGLQIPLHSTSNFPAKILYYHSVQKNGTKEKKYRKILGKVNIIDCPFDVYFYSENYCFVELCDSHSKYKMAGVVNFAGNIDMMGLIILQEK